MPTTTETQLIGEVTADQLFVKNDGAPIPFAALAGGPVAVTWDGHGYRAHHANLPADHAHYLMAGSERATVVHLADSRCVELVAGVGYVFRYSHAADAWSLSTTV